MRAPPTFPLHAITSTVYACVACICDRVYVLQGFAPHFDDVDVYVLQVEGRKRWRVYAPLPGHALPRYSSRDFLDAEIGTCMLDAVLAPGDLLYLPRGTIHQAESLPGDASLHLTVSADHQRSWADLLEAALQVRNSVGRILFIRVISENSYLIRVF
jgi:bifunctional lysine-specific demethylase and histidyl-hydroxylase NO66